MSTEQWKPIIGFELKFEVSTLGNIRRIENKKPIKVSNHKSGYMQAHLRTGKYSRKWIMVHRVVATSFLGISNLVVNHKDYDKTNNELSNLEYVTPRDNAIHGKKIANKTSRFTGVSWNKSNEKWRSVIIYNKKKVFIGDYKEESEAYEAYIDFLNKNNIQSIYS